MSLKFVLTVDQLANFVPCDGDVTALEVAPSRSLVRISHFQFSLGGNSVHTSLRLTVAAERSLDLFSIVFWTVLSGFPLGISDRSSSGWLPPKNVFLGLSLCRRIRFYLRFVETKLPLCLMPFPPSFSIHIATQCFSTIGGECFRLWNSCLPRTPVKTFSSDRASHLISTEDIINTLLSGQRCSRKRAWTEANVQQS